MGMFGFENQFAMFDVTPLENQFILEYMPAAKGDFVKVYLYGLMLCYHPQEDMSIVQMSHELNLDEDEIMAAYRHWERMGLVQRISDKPPQFRYVNVRQLFFMGDKAAVDNDYVAFSESLYAAFGNERSLHTKEISLAYEWVADLGLPTEVVLMLVKHMIKKRGKNFSMQAAQKLAVELAEQKVMTIEDAEMVFDRDRQVWEGSKNVLRRFGKRREPSRDEQELYLKWVRDWGFSPDAIEAACAETTKGEPTFAYLDGILRGMRARQGRGLTTREQVEQTRQTNQEEIAPLKALLAVMNIRVSINEGTKAMYREMRELYPDDVILMAGRECAVKKNADMTDVQSLLQSWSAKGLKNAAEVQAYIASFKEQNELVQLLLDMWGAKRRPTAADRTMAQRWLGEMHLSREMILYCASMVQDVEKPMPYLDKLMSNLAQRGITTAEQAAQDRQSWQEKNAQQRAEKPAGRGKVIHEQQYEQREYANNEDALDRLMAGWKEEDAGA